MSAARKLRPAADRRAERGLPYKVDGAYGFWSVLMTSADRVPVVAFTDEGVFVGYHDTLSALAVAAKVARMRGVDGVVAVTKKETFA